jgi:molybdate transport system substrate-binding protein
VKRAAVVAALVALVVPSASAGGGPITVFAAASLTQVFPRIDKAPRYSFLGSDQLALQIQQGAPADVYAAASPKYPGLLYHARVVQKPIVFATNKLVVIVPKSNPAHVTSVYDLQRTGVRVVIGDKTVPIGSYTRQILDALGIGGNVSKNVVSEETDVKSIVAKVALGEADAGFVYATDAKAVAGRVLVIRLPASAQPSIAYSVAIVKATRNRTSAQAFVNRLVRKPAQTKLVAAGFLPRLASS